MNNDTFCLKLNKYVQSRDGGYVKRCHTISHIIGEYTNGIHSFNCVNMLLLFHPNPSIHLIKSVQWHDICEKVIGDLPGHVGINHPKLREEYKIAEEEEQEKFSSCFKNLSEEDKNWLWYVDILELSSWCNEQWNLGNQYVGEIITTIKKIIDERVLPIPPELNNLKELLLTQRT